MGYGLGTQEEYGEMVLLLMYLRLTAFSSDTCCFSSFDRIAGRFKEGSTACMANAVEVDEPLGWKISGRGR